MSNKITSILNYHQSTKHHFYRFANSLGYMDWDTQPNPFRRYKGASLIPLVKVPPNTIEDDMPRYELALRSGHINPTPLSQQSISQLLFDCLAISAWKQAGEVKWALRVNPSSGNLHPTEGYLICGAVEGLTDTPMVCHYAPKEHLLEKRTQFSATLWHNLAAKLPPNSILVGLSSIHWREVWKYGERAFRYCQHDVGHAIATVSIAAAGLGWQTSLLDTLNSTQVGTLLGILEAVPKNVEAEHPDCLLAIYPQGQSHTRFELADSAIEQFKHLNWQGIPNQLSSDHVDWPIIDEATLASEKPSNKQIYPPIEQWQSLTPNTFLPQVEQSTTYLRPIIHQRRSAVAMDEQTSISRDTFYKILSKTLVDVNQIPMNVLPWSPHIHLALFVHRVTDLESGLYFLIRNLADINNLKETMHSKFEWIKPPACPDYLPLYRLERDDARAISAQISCTQRIASDGCFSLGMIAKFESSLKHYGAWFYPRLFWESGLIGQILYLEAEAASIRATGIGCFFDDAMHMLLGIKDLSYQSLYHFTMGGPIEDTRLTTLPAYNLSP